MNGFKALLRRGRVQTGHINISCHLRPWLTSFTRQWWLPGF
jgi:hypothetical protein